MLPPVVKRAIPIRVRTSLTLPGTHSATTKRAAMCIDRDRMRNSLVSHVRPGVPVDPVGRIERAIAVEPGVQLRCRPAGRAIGPSGSRRKVRCPAQRLAPGTRDAEDV